MKSITFTNVLATLLFSVALVLCLSTVSATEPGDWLAESEGGNAIVMTMSDKRNVMMLMCSALINGLTLSPSPEELSGIGAVGSTLEVRWAFDDGDFNLYRPWTAFKSGNQVMIVGLAAIDASIKGLVRDIEGKSQLRFQFRNPGTQLTMSDHFDLTDAGDGIKDLHCLL